MTFASSYALVAVCRLLGGRLPMVRTVCVYGYSMALWVPATVLCFIPVGVVQLAVLIAGLCASSAFLLRNTAGRAGEAQRTTAGCLVVGSQCLLALVYKLYFFRL